ncbi:SCO family protein [Pseudorhodobacter sp.]|uniref:SCO family protein n=1 Tax=Pseudorhodobacter sp. TaxID=1934400 RepID=UPI002AFDD85B|nr:SCO family protein [Pseudorhodobacter sp.]
MIKIYAGVAVAVVAAVLGGSAYWVYSNQGGDKFDQCRGGQVAGGSIGGPFTLVNQKGETVTDKDVITKPTLVYFGYTFCPDVCPLDSARNAEAVDILEEMGLDVTPVFISIDPARDTPEVMAEFTSVMHPKMIGLTGSEDQVKAASKAYKTYFKKQDSGDEYYLVDHSTFTYLMMPEVGFMDFFKREATPDEMAQTVACFINAS